MLPTNPSSKASIASSKSSREHLERHRATGRDQPAGIGAENTFSADLTTFDAMAAELRPLIDKVWRHCESTGNRGRTVTLKVKFFDFEIITRSRSVVTPVPSRDDLESLAVGLLQAEMPMPKSVRLLGVSLSSLQASDLAEPQLDLPI